MRRQFFAQEDVYVVAEIRSSDGVRPRRNEKRYTDDTDKYRSHPQLKIKLQSELNVTWRSGRCDRTKTRSCTNHSRTSEVDTIEGVEHSRLKTDIEPF